MDIWLRRLLVASFVVLSLTSSGLAQDRATVQASASIPHGSYKSWSLFLVTNQSWLDPNRDQVLDLFHKYDRFGRTITDYHLAVWFWKKDPTLLTPETAAANVDLERAIAYCQKLRLAPSRGPYLIFTTVYPDENVAPSVFSAVELGTSAEQIQRILDRLGDQLVTEGVIRDGEFVRQTGTDDFWRAWFDATRHSLASLGLGLRVAIKTPTLSLDSGGQQ